MSDEQVIEEGTPAENVEEEVIDPTEGEPENLDEGGEPKELEEWQKTDANDEGGEKPKFEKSLKAKKKLKGLLNEREGELTEKEKEIERLRLENERLKAGSLKSDKPLKRPVEDDFINDDGDLDIDKYHDALDEYDDQRAEIRRANKRQQSSQEAQIAAITEGVDSHYTRAEKLVEESGINPDVYKAADIKFRSAFTETYQKNSDAVADRVLAKLGEGSEKVAYFIGNNEAARTKLQTLLRNDPTGLNAAMYLGSENQRLNTNKPATRQSKAPSPATKIKGDALPPGKEGAWKKKYLAAAEGQAQYEVAKAARAAGFNTRNW